mmetsp:Transcript_27167/g.33793  ORF Transcript_27167/g.33793 Transcript_27167/m.33793 type:complete len:168 (+) Transcript_27167:535-1038(+)|eukprot:CAMPEP_0170465398 /NCGR_PEP_ID=MMETSP0123-20130129/9755_1 /TAXON_ID=182087 /ORGANISM="Favella ehrenbergii, Strain Fehren 1" /LENGTH=167 /DNA_ID=CAMNT_0010731281 /DNA_START=535 /DNA_END=1038 /DNA_ORIENTATION=+
MQAPQSLDIISRPLYTTSFEANPVRPADQAFSVLVPVNLKAMTQTLTKKESLDEKVERALCTLAEDMVDDVIDFACRLAKHRGSNSLQRNDVRLAFEKRLKVRVPVKTQPALNGLAAASAAPTQVNSAAATVSANLPTLVAPTAISTANYKSNLALVKKAQEQLMSQ